jgi:hypothetical protein
LAALAESIGFVFHERDVLGAIPTTPWMPLDRRPVRRDELLGQWRGLPIATADVRWGEGSRQAMTLAVVRLRVDLPPTLLGRIRRGRRRDRPVPPPVSLSSATGAAMPSTAVRGADAAFTVKLLALGLRRWLRVATRRFEFALSGSDLFVVAKSRPRGRALLLRPSELPYLLEAARSFCARVPAAVWLVRHDPGPDPGLTPLGFATAAAPGQVIVRPPIGVRVQLFDRIAGIVTAGAAAVLLASSIWSPGTPADWSGMVVALLILASGIYSIFGGRTLRVTRAAILAALGLLWSMRTTHVAGEIVVALALLGAVLLTVSAIAMANAPRVRVSILETGDPGNRDSGVAFVPALPPARQRAPTRAHTPVEGRGLAVRGNVGAAVFLGIAAVAVFLIGFSHYQRASEFSRYGVPIAAHVARMRCYAAPAGDGGGGDPCDVHLVFVANGHRSGATFLGMDDAVRIESRNCRCLPILYDRRDPRQVSTPTIVRPVWIAVLYGAFLAVALFSVVMFLRRPTG